jgi:abortive infection bacteriophage resistance protein
MAKQAYSKPPLAVPDQINLLKSRGLQIPEPPDEGKMGHYLRYIGYYRLSGYMYPFLADPVKHLFKPNTSFQDILDLYKFDRELRLLVFSAIEKIEIAVRSHINNLYSLATADPFWYANSAHFFDQEQHKSLMQSIGAGIKRSTDTFIQHFYAAYTNPYPPAWFTFEILQMGQLSILYSSAAKSSVKKAIAACFAVKEPVFTSWLHTLVYVRNICAHHARLWNKEFRIPVKIPKSPDNTWLSFAPLTDRRIYIILAIIVYLLRIINPGNHFKQKLKRLLDKYPHTDIAAMGFPTAWQDDPFWTGETSTAPPAPACQ